MAWEEVQAANNVTASGTGTTLTKVFASGVTAGSLLVCSITWGTGTGNASFSDNINGAWGATVKTTNDAGNGQSVTTSYFPNSGAGTITITATTPSADHRGMIITEYSGVATVTPLDGTSAGQVQAAATSHTSPTVTVSQADDLVYGFVCEDTAGSATISSSNVTIHGGSTGQLPTIVNNVDIAAGDKNGPASGTTAVTFTFSTSQGAIIQCLCFKQAAAGGASVVPILMAEYRRRRQF